MADERQDRMQQRELLGERGPLQQPVLRHGGANFHSTVQLAYGIQLANARDVDQHRSFDDPQVKHGDKRLPTGKNAGVFAVLRQEGERFINRLGTHVIEGARLHPPFPAGFGIWSGEGRASTPAISAWMRRGVAGSCTSLTPSASAIALAMHAGTLMQLPSARPFAPSGVNGDGVS